MLKEGIYWIWPYEDDAEVFCQRPIFYKMAPLEDILLEYSSKSENSANSGFESNANSKKVNLHVDNAQLVSENSKNQPASEVVVNPPNNTPCKSYLNFQALVLLSSSTAAAFVSGDQIESYCYDLHQTKLQFHEKTSMCKNTREDKKYTFDQSNRKRSFLRNHSSLFGYNLPKEIEEDDSVDGSDTDQGDDGNSGGDDDGDQLGNLGDNEVDDDGDGDSGGGDDDGNDDENDDNDEAGEEVEENNNYNYAGSNDDENNNEDPDNEDFDNDQLGGGEGDTDLEDTNQNFEGGKGNYGGDGEKDAEDNGNAGDVQEVGEQNVDEFDFEINLEDENSDIEGEIDFLAADNQTGDSAGQENIEGAEGDQCCEQLL